MSIADTEARATWLAEYPDPDRPDPADICGLPGSCGAARCTCLRLLGRTR